MANLIGALSKIGLPMARNAAEEVARRILELRQAGRSDEVTDDMMDAASDLYMFDNTPLNMSEAARMARAGDRLPVYHRTSSDFDAFDLGKSQSGEAVFVGPDAGNLQQRHNRKAVGDSIMPLLLKADNRLELDEFNLREMQGRYDGGRPDLPVYITDETAERLKRADFDAIVSKNIYGENSPFGEMNEIAVLKPENLRSEFARFDPEFSHLRNLSASILGAIGFTGIAAGLREKEEGM